MSPKEYLGHFVCFPILLGKFAMNILTGMAGVARMHDGIPRKEFLDYIFQTLFLTGGEGMLLGFP